MVRNAGVVEQQTQRMTRALGGTARSVDDLNRRAAGMQPDAFRALAISALRAEDSVQRLRSVMLAITALATGGFTGAFAVKTLSDTADRYTEIQNKIAAVVPETRARAAIEQQIFDTANRTRSAYEATAVLFQRLQLSASNLGGTQAEILRVVETTQKALQAGGATTQEAQSAAVQLSQALGAGRLQDDELRSILENAPILAQAIAREFGVAVGELKEMGSEGQLTSARVFRALLKASGEVDERFEELKPTINQALVVLDNGFTRYIGQVDQSMGASAALASGIITLSKNLDTLGDMAAIAAPLLAAVFANRVLQRGIGAAGAPFKAAIEERKAALKEAQALEQQAAERMVASGATTAQLRARARTDLDTFADKDLVRDRGRVAKAVEADAAALAKAEQNYHEVAKRVSETDARAITRTSDQIAASPELKGIRAAIREARSELSAAEGDAAKAATRQESTPQRIQLQERLNKVLAREEEIQAKLVRARYDERQNLRDDIGDLSEASAKGTSVRERLQRQAENAAQSRADIEQRIAAIDADNAERSIRAAERVTAAKAATIRTERDLADAVRSRVNEEVGLTNRKLLGDLSDANVARRTAARNLGVTQDVLAASNDEVRANATANATRLLNGAQQQATIAAAGYQRAQQGVAEATARTGLATTVLTTSLGLARSGFGSLVNFLGGYIGTVLTAATVGFALYEIAQARAAARTEEFKKATDGAAAAVKALNEAKASSPAIQATALAAANQTIGTLERGLQEALDNALRAVPATRAVQSVDDLGRAVITNINPQYDALSKLGQKLDETRKQGGDTRSVLQQMIEEIDRLGSSSVDLAGILAPLRELVGVALSGAQALRSVRQAANEAAAARGEFDDARDARERDKLRLPADSARRADLNQQRLRAENSPDAQEKLTEYMNQFYEGRRKALNNFTREFEKEDLTAKGDKIGSRMVGLRAQYPGIDEAELKRLAELQEKNSKSGGRKGAKSEEEKFEDRLKRLQEEGRASFFTDLDRSLIEELKKIKGEPTLLRNTVDAIKTGGQLPEQAQRLREALAMREAGKEYRQIIQAYGTMEQITPQVRAEQEKLNLLLNAGKISADQYGLALADAMGKYKGYAWIDTLSDNLSGISGELAEAALGFKNLDDVAQSFIQTMLKFALNEFMMTPLKNMLRSFFAEMQSGMSGGDFNPISLITRAFTGGIGGSGAGDIGATNGPGIWLSGGGLVEGPGTGTSDSVRALLNGSTDLHLSDGEFVTKAAATKRHLPLLQAINDGTLDRHMARMGSRPLRFASGGLIPDGIPPRRQLAAESAGALGKMEGGGGFMNVSIEPPAGHRAQVQEKRSPTGMEARVVFEEMFAEDIANNGPLAQTLQGVYGVDRMSGRRR